MAWLINAVYLLNESNVPMQMLDKLSFHFVLVKRFMWISIKCLLKCQNREFLVQALKLPLLVVIGLKKTSAGCLLFAITFHVLIRKLFAFFW